ncbi:MAG TPA: bifunctional UDP-N-acetylglucosamine diphosphorylase/glucosamine-1-phosphate N-acetyltransferase GlmU [Candidatus Koribacter sp.]|jgi:bifunctional UDP-N-acetylglucosamine pyrophosphorylase/glucosamine-1-phosphate N-acetyltransferase
MSDNQNNFAIAILAAGKGTRLKSKHPKVLHEIAGKPLLGHVVAAAKHVVPANQIFAIIGHEAGLVRAAMASTGIEFVEQKEQRGTGHAVLQTREALKNFHDVLVLSGDVPLICKETIERVLAFHRESGAAMTVLTTEPADPFGYGRVFRKDGGRSDEVERIVEQKQLSEKQLAHREINSGIYAFRVKSLFAHLEEIKTDNPHGEYYLTDIVKILADAGEKVVALRADDANEVLGVNTRQDLAQLDAQLRADKCRALMNAGVSIFKPETCLIDADVQVGPDTVIEPFVQLLGETKIGSECRIRSYSVVSNSTLGNNVLLRNGSIVDQSHVADGALLGPYCHLRPGSDIGEQAHVGNFVETKKAKLGKGSKANHLTYLGDAEIGTGVNIGAGTITCNYDGVKKYGTKIGDNVFVGSDTTLVAPIEVGSGAYIGAASCITENVPEDALAVGRGRQVNKEGWAKKKRTEQKKK